MYFHSNLDLYLNVIYHSVTFVQLKHKGVGQDANWWNKQGVVST